LAKAVQCMAADFECVVITGADYTYLSEYVPEMIQILEQTPQVGMVCGNRLGQQPERNAFQGRFTFGNKLLGFAQSFLNGVDLQDPLTGLRVVRADMLRKWELNHRVCKQGFETSEVPIGYRERLGEKKLKMRHGATILKRIIFESFNTNS